MKLSRYHVVSQPVVDGRTGESKRVLFATRSAAPRIIDEATWDLVAAGRFEEIPRETLLELVDIEILVPDNEDELEVILARNNAAVRDDENLYLVIQPTAWCQLGCGYCGQSHSRKQLSGEDQRLFLERVREKLDARRYRTLEMSWFGAEPLSGLKVMRAMTPPLLQMTEERGVVYGARVVTNGLSLTDEVATELEQQLAVVHVEITLDGTAVFHDARRHTKGGLPSFNSIFENLLRLARRADLKMNVSVRCNVDRRNHEGVTPLLQMLADAGVQRRISFYVAPIHSWGNDAHKDSLSSEEFAAWEIRWLAQMVRLGFTPNMLPKRRPIVCFAVSPEAELVDANGELFNCSEVSYVPKYGSPNEYAIGTAATGEVPGKRARLADFNDRVGRGEYGCGTCRMLPVCGGACPKLWEEGIAPCPTPKFNIESRLLLQYAMARIQERSSKEQVADENA